jgi:hypothetical protein
MHTINHSSRLSAGLATLIICGSLTACGAAAPLQDQMSSAQPAVAPMAAESAVERSAPDAANIPERMIVRNADLTLVVDDVEERMNAIASIAKKHEGFVVSSNLDRNVGDIRGNVSLRVRSEKIDQALADLRALAIEVRSESSSGQDVTGEFVDLQAQLTNLETAEKQLQKIMEEASKTEDVLNVFNQLTQIRGQIEQIKGRMQYLSESAALSMINVQLISDAASQPVEPPIWRPLGTAKTALDALVNSLKDLADFLIYFVIAILPVLLLVGLPIFIVIRLISRISRKSKLEGVKVDQTNLADKNLNQKKEESPPANQS